MTKTTFDQLLSNLCPYNARTLVLKPFRIYFFFFSVQCLGNHEFENGPEGLAPFLKSKNVSSIPIVTTNIDTGDEPSLTNIRRSAVLSVGNHTVGVVGYLTPDTEVTKHLTKRFGGASPAYDRTVYMMCSYRGGHKFIGPENRAIFFFFSLETAQKLMPITLRIF